MQVLREAQLLKHEQYGQGVVTQSNSQHTTIDFELHGTKKFVTTLLAVQLLSGQAPARPEPIKHRKTRKVRSKTPTKV